MEPTAATRYHVYVPPIPGDFIKMGTLVPPTPAGASQSPSNSATTVSTGSSSRTPQSAHSLQVPSPVAGHGTAASSPSSSRSDTDKRVSKAATSHVPLPPNNSDVRGAEPSTGRASMTPADIQRLGVAVTAQLGGPGFHDGVFVPGRRNPQNPAQPLAQAAVDAVLAFRAQNGDTDEALSPTHIAKRASEVAAAAIDSSTATAPASSPQRVASLQAQVPRLAREASMARLSPSQPPHATLVIDTERGGKERPDAAPAPAAPELHVPVESNGAPSKPAPLPRPPLLAHTTDTGSGPIERDEVPPAANGSGGTAAAGSGSPASTGGKASDDAGGGCCRKDSCVIC